MSLRPVLIFALAAVCTQAGDALVPVPIRQVKVHGEIGRRIDATIRNNLLVLDADKEFLQPFEARDQKGGYIGLGKLILSAVRFGAYTGDPKVIALKDRLIARTIAAQEADGYIGICARPQRVSALWDVHETGYLIAGLLSDSEYFGKPESLAAARKAADYVLAHWNAIPADWGEKTGVATHVAVTGLERTLIALHRATGDVRYLDFVVNRRALASWDLPIVVGRRPGIEGHIYAYTARSLAQLELYRLQPRPALLTASNREIDFLTRRDGMAITGAAGQWEIWTADQDGRGELGETCATAYQIRLYDSLMRLNGESRYGDLMERAIYNALFAAQSPDGRRIRYYTPFEGPRAYHPGDTYCCPNNYRRIVAELPELVYYRSGTGVAVNLYTPSEVTLDAGGAKVTLRQETGYPSNGDAAIAMHLARPARFPLRLRIPAWATGATVQLPGSQPAPAQPGTFFAADREWRDGDTVRVRMPMPVRLVKGRKRQDGRAAVMRGPLVFCLDPRQDGSLANLDGADLGRFTLDPASMAAVEDNTVRPGGTAIRVGAWKPSHSLAAKPEITLRFTEFPDPSGTATYFRLRDASAAVEDELIR